MNIEEIVKLSNEYQALDTKYKEVSMLLKERSDFGKYTITHGNFDIDIHSHFKPLVIEFLEDYQEKMSERLEEIKTELNTNGDR